jgi:hypothetical protein
VAQQALQLFCNHILQCHVLQGQVGVHPLEAAILVFELFQPLLQAVILRFPLVIGCGADPIVRQISLTGRPASASLRMATICVSVNFDCRMRTSWLRVSILPEDSPCDLSQIKGSLHKDRRSRYSALPLKCRRFRRTQIESRRSPLNWLLDEKTYTAYPAFLTTESFIRWIWQPPLIAERMDLAWTLIRE